MRVLTMMVAGATLVAGVAAAQPKVFVYSTKGQSPSWRASLWSPQPSEPTMTVTILSRAQDVIVPIAPGGIHRVRHQPRGLRARAPHAAGRGRRVRLDARP